MSILLSDLVLRLQADVAAEDGVPSTAQYERAITDAVIDFGNRAGRVKRATLNVLAGISSYVLPDDFISMVKIISHYAEGGVMVTSTGLVVVGPGYCEEYRINGQTITFYPTPTYAMEREYRYKAGWALNIETPGAEYYEDLTEREASVILLLAGSLANGKKENAAGGGFMYRQGDVTVDTSAGAVGLNSLVKSLKDDYAVAVANYIGTVLVM